MFHQSVSRLIFALLLLASLTLPMSASAASGDSPIARFNALRNQASELRRNGQIESAIEISRNCVAHARENFGAEDITFAIASDDLSFALLLRGHDEEAVRYREISFDIYNQLAKSLEETLAKSDVQFGDGNESPPAIDNTILAQQIQRVGGIGQLCTSIAFGLTNNLHGKFQKIDASSIDTAWRLSKYISDKPPTDAKCLILDILSALYYSRDLNRSRLCLNRLVELAPKATDKSIMRNAIRDLARVCLVQADYMSTFKYATAALTVDRKFDGKENSPAQQEDLLLLARASCACGFYKDSFEYFRQLLNLYKELPPDPKVLADTEIEYASLLLFSGEYKEAYETLKDCKEKTSMLFGEHSEESVQVRQMLGWAAFTCGNYEEAETVLRAVLQSQRTRRMDPSGTLGMLSRLTDSTGGRHQSKKDLVEHSSLWQSRLEKQLPQLTLAEQIAFLNDAAQPIVNQLLTHCSREEGVELTDYYDRVLGFRGLIVDSLKTRANALRTARGAAPFIELTEKLKQGRNKLLRLRSESAQNETPEIIEALEAVENTQREIMEYLRTVKPNEAIPFNHEILQKTLLRPDECLIDIYKYFNLHEHKSKYGAFVVRPNLETVFIDLGSSGFIDEVLNSWIRSIRGEQYYVSISKTIDKAGRSTLSATRDIVRLKTKSNQPSASEETCRAEFRKAIDPLLSKLTSKDRRLIICGDGEFFRVPWSLVFEKAPNAVLTEELDSPKQLSTRNQKHEEQRVAGENSRKDSVLLMGDVDFGSSGLPSLTGSKKELERITVAAAKADKSVVPLTGRSATKPALIDNLPQNRFIHLATHGIFLSPQANIAKEDFVAAKNIGWFFSQRSPLLASSLCVAEGTAGDIDSREITADEILNLDLSKIDHVALSACETGLGESFRGQGVLGLRAAFAAAGAKTILLSLWPVDDIATGELMAEYYAQLWENELKPAEALKIAQDKIKHHQPQPYFWAGWAIAGDAW